MKKTVICVFLFFALVNCQARKFNSHLLASVQKQEPWKRTVLNTTLLKDLYASQDVKGLENQVLRPELAASLRLLKLRLENKSIDPSSRQKLTRVLNDGATLENAESFTIDDLVLFSARLTCVLTDSQEITRQLRVPEDSSEKRLERYLCSHKDKRSEETLLKEVANNLKIAKDKKIWLLPTWADLSIQDFNQLLSFPIFPIGLTFKSSQFVDGEKNYTPVHFFVHDLGHFSITPIVLGTREFYNFPTDQLPRTFEEVTLVSRARENFLEGVEKAASKLYKNDATLIKTILFDFLHEKTTNTAALNYQRDKSAIKEELRIYLDESIPLFQNYAKEPYMEFPSDMTYAQATYLRQRKNRKDNTTLYRILIDTMDGKEKEIDAVVENVGLALQAIKNSL